MRVRLLAPHQRNRQTFRPGQVLDLGEPIARWLVSLGRAELVPDKNPEPAPTDEHQPTK